MRKNQIDMTRFDFGVRPHVVFGANEVDLIGGISVMSDITRVLLVTDPGVVTAGHAGRVSQAIESSGVDVVVFDQVRENPTTRDVDACLEVARGREIDLIVGVGGGSALDTAKGCNFLLTNGGCMQDYRGENKTTKPMLPSIAIPTTTGTGSEMQSFALIADEDTHEKMACGDPEAAARVAILDPTLAATQPPRVLACAGLDCLAHGVEAAVTKARNPLSLLFAQESFRLLQANFGHVLNHRDDLNAQGSMQLAAAYAGVAIENSMLGAAHSLANPLTAKFGLVHGHAVGLMLPNVVRFNAKVPEVAACYATLVRSAGLVDRTQSDARAAEVLVATIEDLLRQTGLATSLEACGVTRDSIGALAAIAATQWTAQFNPRPINADDFARLYEAAFSEQP